MFKLFDRSAQGDEAASQLVRLNQDGAPSSALTSSPSVPDPEPMQVGRLRLTAKEKQDRLARGLCLYCGKPGHRAIRCPLKAGAHQ